MFRDWTGIESWQDYLNHNTRRLEIDNYTYSTSGFVHHPALYMVSHSIVVIKGFVSVAYVNLASCKLA